MEIIDLQDISLQMNKTSSTEDFWIKQHAELDKYTNCKTLAIKLATMFGSTYIRGNRNDAHETGITSKDNNPTKLNLENTLRISCSPRVPDFKKLAQEKKCHFSH
ncbi:Hypothetical protein CINCED_3A025920 [Cinara cedri]|uniref:Uncharacterized protein n=1 Tax=Cinara cedri TaxID=506608 RepID=A0A5E4MTX0_9HEMI|nr:Hypothetical protein CINCED_3A025920 [Cinara cedri]